MLKRKAQCVCECVCVFVLKEQKEIYHTVHRSHLRGRVGGCTRMYFSGERIALIRFSRVSMMPNRSKGFHQNDIKVLQKC